MKEFILIGLGFIGFGLTFAWFFISILKDIHSKRFSKEANMRYGKTVSKVVYRLYIVGCVYIFIAWLGLFLFFLSFVFTPSNDLIDEIIMERTIQIIPDIKSRQAEQYQEFLDKKNNMQLH